MNIESKRGWLKHVSLDWNNAVCNQSFCPDLLPWGPDASAFSSHHHWHAGPGAEWPTFATSGHADHLCSLWTRSVNYIWWKASALKGNQGKNRHTRVWHGPHILREVRSYLLFTEFWVGLLVGTSVRHCPCCSWSPLSQSPVLNLLGPLPVSGLFVSYAGLCHLRGNINYLLYSPGCHYICRFFHQNYSKIPSHHSIISLPSCLSLYSYYSPYFSWERYTKIKENRARIMLTFWSVSLFTLVTTPL